MVMHGAARVGLALSVVLGLTVSSQAVAAADAIVPAKAAAAPVNRAAAASRPQATIGREAVPAWVTPRAMPDMMPEQRRHVENGQAFLLVDTQVRGGDSGYVSVARLASKVVDRTGLENAGQISITFDPRIEDVAMGFVHIIRDGKVIDRTGDLQFSVVEREDDLDDGIVSGNLRAISNLKDVRVGDIVDYSVIRHTRSTLWPGHYFTTFTGRFSDPVPFRAIRILWPASRPLTFKPENTAIRFAETQNGDMREWQWSAVNPPFGPGEDNVPAWYPQWGQVDVSSMTSWAQVAQWTAKLYVGDETLPPDYEKRLADIASKWPKAEDRLTQITRYVQDNIRYVGEEIGEGSYVPRRPSVVLTRGYGDCKDKSELLAVSLRRLGIDAVPALVSTTPGFDLPDRLPSPLMFDHVIVRVKLGGHVLWLDPTATHRGGRGLDIVPSDLGYALPILPDQTGLEKLSGYAAHAGAMDVLEQFAVDENAATAMTLHVETKYTGAQADWMRTRLAQRGQANISRQNLQFYQKRFAGLASAKDVEFRDDLDGNTLLMVEDYTLAKADFDKDKILSDLSTNAYAVKSLVPARQSGPRLQPLAMPGVVSRNQVIELKAVGRVPGVPDDVSMTADGLTYTRTSKLSGDTVRMTYHLEGDDREMVPASEADAIYAISDKIDDGADLTFHLDQSPAPAKDDKPAGPLDRLKLAPYRDDLAKAAGLMQKTDQPSRIAALTIFNQVADKLERPSPEAGLVDGLKGATLAELGRNAAARQALESSIETYQDNAPVFQVLLGLQIADEDPGKLLETMRVALKYQPSVIADLSLDWVRYLAVHIHQLPKAQRDERGDDLCTILTGAKWHLTPRTEEGAAMLACAIEANLKRGDTAQARALLALKPGPGAMVRLAVDKRYAALWPDLSAAVNSGFKDSIAGEVAEAERAAKAAPEDFAAAKRYVTALRMVGEPEKAVAAGRALADRKNLIEASGDPAFWFVNEYAYALADAGQVDAALARFDGILALGVEANPVLVSQVINRAEVLASQGRSAEALAAYAEADQKYSDKASLFGKMWIWAGEACALRELNRADEANAFDAKLAEHPDENHGAITDAAACRGDVAAIEKQLLARLDDPIDRDQALAGFIQFRQPKHVPPIAAKREAVMKAARSSPAVQAKFKEYGRAVTFDGQQVY